MEAVLNKEIIINKTASRILGVSVFVALTALGAFVRLPLPFTPVPLTLQTFFVLLAGLFLGPRLGAISQASYIILGAAGVPLFTLSGAGATYLFGPTAGYLFGFVFCALIVGSLKRYAEGKFISLVTLLVLADLVILLCGASWLKFITGFSFNKALALGLLPFLAGDLIKILICAQLYLNLRKRIK